MSEVPDDKLFRLLNRSTATGNDQIVEQVILELDRRDAEDERRRKGYTLAMAARWYASQGFKVFPLRYGTKVPAIPAEMDGSGVKDATSDRDQVLEWWERNADYNIGIATGHLVDVIDIDGREGIPHWAAMVEAGQPKVLGVVSTPRPGGAHLYIAATGRGNTARMKSGVDFRGLGGYVVAPPSRLVEVLDKDNSIRQHGGTYRWHRPINLEGA